MFGSVMSQAPPSASSTTEHLMVLDVPGIGISTSLMLRRTHSSSNVSFGTQNLSKLVGV